MLAVSVVRPLVAALRPQCVWHQQHYSRPRYSTIMASLQAVEPVDIDVGKFKYILCKVEHGDDSKFIVRGYIWAEWHNNIYDKIAPELEGQDIKCSCVGGGKIKHNAEDKTIHVFGESKGFGKADHSVSVGVIKSKYSDYDVKWSDEEK